MLLIMFAVASHAQILSAKVGINGLTCSQCSRSVEMQLRKLSFVKDVDMDLGQTEGTLQFRKGSDIDFSKIAKAVKDAGFSVRFLSTEIDMQQVAITQDGFKIGNDFYFVPDVQHIPQHKAAFRFLGKMYSSQKESSKTSKIEQPAKGHVYNLVLL